MSFSAGDKLGPYEIVAPLGAGGMGEVFRAKDSRLGRDVAIKVLPDHLSSDTEAQERFEREAKAIAALSHPNILTLHDFGDESGVKYAVTELLEGETLSEHLQRETSLPWRRALEVGSEIAKGLSAAHKKGIIHRDIKPSNIFLSKDGSVKILDFGLAKSFGLGLAEGPDTGRNFVAATAAGSPTIPGTVLGTIGYMSPEQAKGNSATTASDVFSLGCVFYEMFAGKKAFERETAAETIAAILKEEPGAIRESGQDVPAKLRKIVRKSLEKEPDARHPSGTEFLADLDAYESTLGSPVDVKATARFLKSPLGAAAAALSVALIVGAFFWATGRESREDRARDTAIPEVMRLIDAGQYMEAFELAREAEEHVPDDSVLSQLWAQMGAKVSIHTTPSGADVYYKAYSDVDGNWRHLGQTSIDGAYLPWGVFRYRIEKEGYETVEAAQSRVNTTFFYSDLTFTLDKVGSLPPGMIAVEAGVLGTVPLSGIPVLQSFDIDRFAIDKTEVTNGEYKNFVDAGGYESEIFWINPFIRDGEELTWKDAMDFLVDSTGRSGPATWELGEFPEGEADYPVGGISWYEAAAYAKFRGKSLPTVYHWVKAALAASEITAPLSPSIVLLSNFGLEGPQAVGTSEGISVAGVYDMAGNVREWCLNASGERRLSLGGAWSDPSYTLTLPYRQSPWDRSAENGFRCVTYLDDDGPVPSMAEAIGGGAPDYYAATPFSDEVFASMAGRMGYAPTALNPVLKEKDENSRDWVHDTVEVNTVYGEEALTIHLGLPKNAAPPYQPIIVFHGIQIYEPVPFDAEFYFEGTSSYIDLSFIMKSGRALVYPIYSDTLDRSEGRTGQRQADPNSGQELFREWSRDLGRTIDYLETRADIDADRAGYVGVSLGGFVSIFVLPFEDRLKAAVIISGGLLGGAIESVSLAQRVTIPVLMLNGKYDYVFPHDTSQKPYYDFLGTPEENKRHIVYDAGHFPLPRNEIIRETLDWLDTYLGPVEGS